MPPPKKKAKTSASGAVSKTPKKKPGTDAERETRKRRESKGYEPEDFTMASERDRPAKESGVPKGRGFKLSEIPVVKATIEKIPFSHEDLTFVYTFVFGPRGKVTKKEMKERLLEFNGYLPALPKGKFDEDEMDKEEDKYEVGGSV
jgi:hypothetical protein